MSDRTYFLVSPDSPVMSVINAALERRRQFIEAICALKTEFGAEASWTSNDVYFRGLQFPKGTAIPAGWRQLKGKQFAVPDKRSKAGRELSKRFKDLPQGVDGMAFASMMTTALKAEYTCCDDSDEALLWTTGYERHGATYVLVVPIGCKASPPGCTELKMSEYWRIVEAAKEEAAHV